MAVNKVNFTSNTAWETQKQINDNFTELDENKADNDDIPVNMTDLNNDGNFVQDADYVHTDNNYSDTEKSKLAGIEAGAEANVQSDYNQTDSSAADFIKNKPDLSNFITNTVDNLVNYYKKSETYTQAEVNALVSAIPKFKIKVVSSLPVSDISTTTIYLLTVSGASSPNLYDEYIYANQGTEQQPVYVWEKLGTQTVDLSGYVQKTTTIAGIDLQDNITVAELQTALSDSTHRFVSDTEKSTWNAKQNAAVELSFTDSDSGWSSTADSNGFYTLTIVSALTPLDCYKIVSGKKQRVLAGLDYDGTNIYVITDTKFSGIVKAL